MGFKDWIIAILAQFNLQVHSELCWTYDHARCHMYVFVVHPSLIGLMRSLVAPNRFSPGVLSGVQECFTCSLRCRNIWARYGLWTCNTGMQRQHCDHEDLQGPAMVWMGDNACSNGYNVNAQSRQPAVAGHRLPRPSWNRWRYLVRCNILPSPRTSTNV